VADVPPRVEVRGFRELAIGSERLFAKLGRSGDAASQQVGDGVAGIVRARVPRRTGALAGTVSADDAGSGVVDVSMGGSLRYGGWIEFGGGHERNYWITDTSRTKVWQYDSNTVYVPFEVLQKDLGMDAQSAEVDGKPVQIPARTKQVDVRVKPQWASDAHALMGVRDKIRMTVRKVLADKPYVQSEPVVRTWEETQAKYIGAIEKEKLLVTFLFGMISIVAIFLIFCIFYMIVVEKTKDIGIIKSVGATNAGVAGIFLGYGLAIGIVGAAFGLLFGYLIVHNINYLHAQMGKLLNIQIWNPEVYAFDTIPNTMAPKEVAIILIVAMISAVLGAMVPAVRAARMQPVEALRWE